MIQNDLKKIMMIKKEFMFLYTRYILNLKIINLYKKLMKKSEVINILN